MARMQLIGDYAGALIKVVVLIAAVGGAVWAWHHGFFGLHKTETKTVDIGPAAPLDSNLKITYPAPDFTDIAQWFNSKELSMKDLKGHVVLVNFWAYSSVESARALPYLSDWDNTYRGKGLVIVGVHSPQFEFERKLDNIDEAIQKAGITYPVAADNELATWNAYENNFYPAQYLVDANGAVVYRHFGKGGYDTTENNIRSLLGLPQKAATSPDVPSYPGQTPEIFLGYNSGAHIPGKPDVRRDVVENYPDSAFMPDETWMIVGPWKKESQRVVSQEANVVMRLHFNAQRVFLVMGTSFGAAAKVVIRLNGSAPGGNSGKDVDKDGTITLGAHRFYELIDQHSPKNGLLEIIVRDPDVEMYAFSFE